jgi:HlyD family secretion protein
VVDRRDDVLRIPASALRFRPEGFDATTAARPARTASPGAAEAAAGGGAGAGAGGGRRRRAGAGGGAPGATDASAPGGARAGGGGNRPTFVFALDEKGEPQAVRIRPGLADGQFVEVVDGLSEGQAIVTGVATEAARGASPRPGGSPAANPFAPAAPQRRTR